jgi:CheY-like chemotaxis protein
VAARITRRFELRGGSGGVVPETFLPALRVEMTRVLLAEDEPLLREILVEGLVDEGFEVEAGVDGMEALLLYRTKGPFDALLLDEEMPGLTGRQLLRLLRGEGDRVAAVILSGNLVLDAREQSELGIGPVLRKPTSMRDLCAALQDAIAAAKRPPGP